MRDRLIKLAMARAEMEKTAGLPAIFRRALIGARAFGATMAHRLEMQGKEGDASTVQKLLKAHDLGRRAAWERAAGSRAIGQAGNAKASIADILQGQRVKHAGLLGKAVFALPGLLGKGLTRVGGMAAEGTGRSLGAHIAAHPFAWGTGAAMAAHAGGVNYPGKKLVEFAEFAPMDALDHVATVTSPGGQHSIEKGRTGLERFGTLTQSPVSRTDFYRQGVQPNVAAPEIPGLQQPTA